MKPVDGRFSLLPYFPSVLAVFSIGFCPVLCRSKRLQRAINWKLFVAGRSRTGADLLAMAWISKSCCEAEKTIFFVLCSLFLVFCSFFYSNKCLEQKLTLRLIIIPVDDGNSTEYKFNLSIELNFINYLNLKVFLYNDQTVLVIFVIFYLKSSRSLTRSLFTFIVQYLRAISYTEKVFPWHILEKDAAKGIKESHKLYS